MKNDIIEWLNNNNNNEQTINNNNNDTSFIECILIISINGILIERQSLIDYCNNVILYNNNNNNSSDIRNNNNKRYNRVDNEISSSYFYGLSSQQFQTIYNNINSLSHKSNPIITTTLNKNSPTEYISSNNNSNKIKFNSSITIISENNKRILNKQHDITSNTTTKSTIIDFKSYNDDKKSRKKIKNGDHNKSNGSGNRNIDIIFFLVWRNIVIKNEILFHTRLYNIHLGKLNTLTFNELSTYKYRSYLDKLVILENYNIKDGGDEIERNVDDKYYIFKANLIPVGVSSVQFNCNTILQAVNSIPHSVNSVVFNSYLKPNFNQVLIKGILPNSITNLGFYYGINSINSNQSLSLDWLPNSLKSLTLFQFQQDIEPNQLPRSLTELKLDENYKGRIVEGSIPSSAVKSFHYKFESNENKNELTNESIPVSTTNLEFDWLFNQTIRPGDIPHNVSLMKLSSQFNNEIQIGSLPLSLKSLYIGDYFNRSINTNVLPSNLTYIDMGWYDQPLPPNLFPQSITSIKMYNFSQPIPVGYFYNYANLKSLKFNNFDQVIPVKTLPHSLTSLNLGFLYNLSLNVNALPSSLLTLKIGELNIQSTSQLPSSITSLSTFTRSPIPAGILPCNLKELYIQHEYFNQQLSMSSFEQGILPQSLQSIYINIYNKNLLNSMDTHFFNKYIKLINVE